MMYRIDDIDFSRTPKDTFSTKDGKELSFMEYYETKYGKKLQNPRQPLIINKNKKDAREIMLIPELCVVTGLSQEMRNNFNLMKELSKTTKPEPAKRLEEASKLVQIFLEKPETKELLQKWSITLDADPINIGGSKLMAGNMLMDKTVNPIPLENTPDIDRKAQAAMFDQPHITRWAIFCPSRDKQTYQTFVDTLKESIDTYKYPADQPRAVFIDGNRFDDWRNQMQSILNESVQAVVLLLPGPKKQAPLYNDCKRFLIEKCPVPSQVVLLKTIQAGKQVRSICNKILMQICAKVGGIPWIVDELPFSSEPTMIIGIDVYHKTSNKNQSLLAFCATMNRHFSKYWSTVREQEIGQEIGTRLQTAILEALREFKETNKIFPKNVIVYRDGVSASQRKTVQEMEVKAFLRAFDELSENKETHKRPNLIFICANKTVGAKFYAGDNLMRPGGPLRNPEPGTIIDKEISHGRDFYLISQKTNQGTATPTHYFVLGNYTDSNGEYSDKDLEPAIMRNIEILTYKLCYLYYNWTGAIKVPSPIQYAHKLSNLIGDRWKSDKPMIPSKHFQKTRSLFFI